jgi:hypothetical protein
MCYNSGILGKGNKMLNKQIIAYGNVIITQLKYIKLRSDYNEFDALYEAKEYDAIWDYLMDNLNINKSSKDPEWRAIFAFDTIMQSYCTEGLCAFYYEEHSNYEKSLTEFANDAEATVLFANEINEINEFLSAVAV